MRSRSAATTFFLFLVCQPVTQRWNFPILLMLTNIGVISTIPTNLLSHEAIGFPAVSFNFNPMRKPMMFSFQSKTLLIHYSEVGAQRLLPFHRYLLVLCPKLQNALFSKFSNSEHIRYKIPSIFRHFSWLWGKVFLKFFLVYWCYRGLCDFLQLHLTAEGVKSAGDWNIVIIPQ